MRLTLFILCLLTSYNVFAYYGTADANGYVAQYECYSGNANCNVAVATYIAHACDTTITTADSDATIDNKINNNQYVCVQNGDYSGKNVFTITASGSSAAYHVLRYTRASDTNDDPWNQTSGNQAKIKGLDINGNYWIIHRLTFYAISGSSPSPRIQSNSQSGHQILDRIWVTGTKSSSIYYGYSQDCNDGSGYTDITIQNSVFNTNGPGGPLVENIAVDLQCGSNLRAVNNEIYDWSSHAIQTGQNGHPTLSGLVVENNDMYFSTAFRSDCAGNFSVGGDCNAGETLLSNKFNGTSGSPGLIIHNRIWGARFTDLNLCCNGEPGAAFNISNAGASQNQYILFQNNIFGDSEYCGFTTTTGESNLISFVGNVCYDISDISGNGSFGLDLGHAHYTELYLNSFLVNDAHLYADANTDNSDFRCNVYVSGGSKSGTGFGTATQVDYNTFYGTTEVTTESPDHDNGNYTLNTRANSTAYSLGDIIRTSATAAEDGTSSDFLYKVTTAGTTAGSNPGYTTTLGGTTTDGTAVVTAVRGPLRYFRKLRTGSTAVYIPYAVPHSSASEYNTCPSSMADRTGIGINNDTAPW